MNARTVARARVTASAPGPAARTRRADPDAALRELVRLVVAGLEAVACTWSRAGWEHGARALAVLLRHPDAPPRAWAERQLLPLLRANLNASLALFERRAPAWSVEAFTDALELAIAGAWPSEEDEELAGPAHEAHALRAAIRAARLLPAVEGRVAPPRTPGRARRSDTVVPLFRASLPRTLRFVQRELAGPGRRTIDAEQALRLRDVRTPDQALDHVAQLLRRGGLASERVVALGRASPDALTLEVSSALTASQPRRRVDASTPVHTWDLGHAQPLLRALLDLTALQAWGLWSATTPADDRPAAGAGSSSSRR